MSKVHTSGVTVKVRTDRPLTVKIHVTDHAKRRQLLRFGQGNAKLDHAIFTFSLPAGWSCPFAHTCLSKSDRKTGRVKDGPDTEIRCYAASMEARRQSVRDSRSGAHFDRLRRCKTTEAMTRLILDSLSPYAGWVRVHDSGDFFSLAYFDAWLEVARQRPGTRFYFYTKALRLWVQRLDLIGDGHTPGSWPMSSRPLVTAARMTS